MDNLNITIVRVSDGSTFNIGKGSDWKLASNGLEGFGEFSQDITYVDNGIHDGGQITNVRMGSVDRTIKCAYTMRSNNPAMRRKTTAFFKARDTFKVYLTYLERTLWAEGTIYKLDFSMEDASDALMILSITFMFSSPYLKSYDDFGKDIASIKPMIAFPYLCALDTKPMGTTGGVFNFDKSVLIENNGDVETYCRAVLSATGEVVNPKFLIGDAYIRVIDTLQANDVIVMDFTSFPPTVTKNGSNCIGKCDRSSTFTEMVIDKGDVTISFDADDGEQNLAVSVYYNELYSTI